MKKSKPDTANTTDHEVSGSTSGVKRKEQDSPESPKYGPWTVLQRGGRRASKAIRGKNGTMPSAATAPEVINAADNGGENIATESQRG